MRPTTLTDPRTTVHESSRPRLRHPQRLRCLRRLHIAGWLVVGILATVGCAGMDLGTIDEMLREAQGEDGLTESTVIAGLKEALKVGTQRTVSRTSVTNGFLNNDKIRIPLPDKLDDVGNTLRTIGFGAKVDEFETGMNRAAEQAAGEATDVFWNAITSMTLQDAFDILRGEDTAATDYFRDRTEATLLARFDPIVQQKMRDVRVYQQYETLMDRYNRIPLVDKPTFDLEDYIGNKTLDGLFSILAEEEKKIREDPVARTTELLRRVFAAQ